MTRRLLVIALAAACGAAHPHAGSPASTLAGAERDPVGPHRDEVAALVKPFLDGEVIAGLVVGIFDGDRIEIYGFGKGPGGRPPDGHTLYELGPVTEVYTDALLASAVQRHEVALDTPLSQLLPPGVTAPTRDGASITLGELALHTSGLPRVPPAMTEITGVKASDLYAHYDEDALYADLVRTQLLATPGAGILHSGYGTGVLGFVLGKKLAGNYALALAQRLLGPLGLSETYVASGPVPAGLEARLAAGTSSDLQPVAPARWSALAGAGAVVSSARDQLRLIRAELDAAVGAKRPPLPALYLTQQPALDHQGTTEGLGWDIDSDGHYHQSGGSPGFHTFLEVDPKHRRGLVILSSTAVSVVDELGTDLIAMLDGHPPHPAALPTAAQLAPLAGTYDLSGTHLVLSLEGKRLYLSGQGTKVRLVPFNDHEFWIEELQSVAVFERDAGKIARIVFVAGGARLSAARVP